MTRTAARNASSRKTGTDLDAWLLDEPELDPPCLALLTAYRDASDAMKKAAPAPVEGDAAIEAAPVAEAAPPAEAAPAAVRTIPAVLRFGTVAGVEDDQLASVHGRMLALGYLTAEVLGKGEGLAYRITREGLRRLNGEVIEAEAAEAA